MRSCWWKLEAGFWAYRWICILGPSGSNVVSRSQTPRSISFFRFLDFIGFISCWENEVLFLKIETRVLTYGLISPLQQALGPNWPKQVFRPQTSKCQSFGIWKFFHVKLHKILHKISSCFQIFGSFLSYQCLFPENCKKTLQKSSSWCHSKYVTSIKACLRKPRFLEH